jgi:hypothetical protein
LADWQLRRTDRSKEFASELGRVPPTIAGTSIGYIAWNMNKRGLGRWTFFASRSRPRLGPPAARCRSSPPTSTRTSAVIRFPDEVDGQRGLEMCAAIAAACGRTEAEVAGH